MNIALIMSAGSGKRLGSTTPKQYLKLKGITVLEWSIKAFQTNNSIDAIYVVVNKNFVNTTKEILKLGKYNKVKDVILGGETRQQSVMNALQYLWDNRTHEDDIVLIHDAARPFVTQEIIDNNIKSCLAYGAADTAIKVSDSLCKSIDGQAIYECLPRKHIYQSQTPQSFRFGTIYNAHQNAKEDVTDDVQLVTSYGFRVNIVEGNPLNFKITTKEDFELAKLISKKTA